MQTNRVSMVMLLALAGALSTPTRATGDAPKPAPSASVAAATATVLASVTSGIMRVVADDTSLYWANFKKVQAVDKTGGAVRDVVTAIQGVDRIDVVGGKLYWAVGGVFKFDGKEVPNPAQVFTLTKPSTATRVLADAKLPEPVARVVASGTSVCVYSTNWGTAMFLTSLELVCFDPTKTSGYATATLGWSSGEMHLAAVGVDEKNVYAIRQFDDGLSHLLSIPYVPTGKSTVKETKLLSVDFADQGGEIVATTDALIFFDTSGLIRVTKTTPSTRTMLAAGASGSQVVTDATHVYWNSLGKIQRAALAGGGKAQHVVGTKASSFTIDATSIYWMEGGKISKLPK